MKAKHLRQANSHPIFQKEISTWNNDDVLQWLLFIGYRKFVDQFQELNINGSDLCEADNSQLIQFGIKPQFSKQMLKEIQKLKEKKIKNIWGSPKTPLSSPVNITLSPQFNSTKTVSSNFSTPNCDLYHRKSITEHLSLQHIPKSFNSEKSDIASKNSKPCRVQFNSPTSPHKKSKIATGTLTSNCVLSRTISPTKKEKFTFYPNTNVFETTFDPDTSDNSTLKQIQRVQHREIKNEFQQFKTLSISERDNKPKFRPTTTIDKPHYKEHEKNVNTSQRKMRDTEINNWEQGLKLMKTF